MVAQQATQGRLRQEQLAQTVARSAAMPSQNNDQTQYLRAQLAHRDAQLEHVRSERDTHFAQEEELLAHRATEVQKRMDKQFKLDGDKQKRTPRLGKSNSAQAQTLAVRLQESDLEHQKLHTASERQLQLEAQALRRSHDLEQQAASTALDREVQLQELREHSDAQPQLLKTQWKHQMSQQVTYKAGIHELYTEIVNIREKSEL